MKKLFVIITTGILLLLNSPLVFPEEHVFALEEHCLAYKTVKTMFFFADVDVIGKSCDVTAEMHWEESGEKAQVEVSVPVKTLDSGNPFATETFRKFSKPISLRIFVSFPYGSKNQLGIK